MIEGSCWMCLLENQLTGRLKIIQLTDNSEKILLDLAANQLQLPHCVPVASIDSDSSKFIYLGVIYRHPNQQFDDF